METNTSSAYTPWRKLSINSARSLQNFSRLKATIGIGMSVLIDQPDQPHEFKTKPR